MGATDSDGAAHSPPHPSMNTSTSRDRLWRKRLNELSAVWPDFVSGRTGGLHKTRVASRRIREALPIVGASRAAGEGQEAQQENARADALHSDLSASSTSSSTSWRTSRRLRVCRAARSKWCGARSRRGARRCATSSQKHAPVGDLKKLIKKLERVGAKHEEEGQREEGRGKKSKSGRLTRKFEAQWRGVLATRLMRRAKSCGDGARPRRAAVRARAHSRRAHLDEEAPLRARNRARRRRGRGDAARQNPEAPAGAARAPARSADAAEARARSGSVARRRFARERSDGVCRFARARMPPAACRLRRASRRARRRW